MKTARLEVVLQIHELLSGVLCLYQLVKHVMPRQAVVQWYFFRFPEIRALQQAYFQYAQTHSLFQG